jgi:hypothetical protein
MSLTSQRYKIAPQLKDYDCLPTDWRPYTMFRQASKYSSDSVNTDETGQRLSFDRNGNPLSFSNLDGPFDLIVGASTAFGVGATHDKNTIASQLSILSGRQTLSLTGRAYNSYQELLLFVEYLHKFSDLGKIIIISGANNLYVSAFRDKYGIPFFMSDYFYNSIRVAALSRKKRLLAMLFDTIGGQSIDWGGVNKTNIFQKIYEGFGHRMSTDDTPDVNVQSAAHRTIQDLSVFHKLAKSIGAQLSFCLQPVAGWMQKTLVNEEKILFDTIQARTSEILNVFSHPKIHQEYSSVIENYCTSSKLNFCDLSSCIKPSNNWMYVDRVHLTDAGNSLIAQYIFQNFYE